MIVKELSIKNVLGVRELELSPGRITVISGKNSVGKTSTMEAIKSAIGGKGKLAQIKNIHAGEDEPAEIVMRLEDDEGTEYEIRKTDSRTTVKKQIGYSAAKEKVSSPQRFLDSLLDGELSNPIKFLECDVKKRADLMLEAIDLNYSFKDLLEAMGLKEEELDAVPEGIHPLSAIALHRSCIFRKRTGINRDEKAKRSTAQEMLSSVPAETPSYDGLEDAEDEVSALESHVSRLFAENKAELEKAKSDITAKKEKEIHDAIVNGTSKSMEVNNEAAKLLSELSKQMDEVKHDRDLRLQELNTEAIEIEQEIKSKYFDMNNLAEEKYKAEMESTYRFNDELSKKREELVELRSMKDRAIEVDAIKSMAKRIESEADSLRSESTRFTDALNALDEYKIKMCEDLPVPGLEISDGEILIDGVPWSQVNTAKQIEVAVRIAAIRSRKQILPIMWVDGAERLDSDNLKFLKELILKEGVQAFIGRVSDESMTIEKE